MSLIRSLIASTSGHNKIDLSWSQPLGFNSSGEELIITKTDRYFPTELYNSSFSTKATDPRGIEIFRGSTITGTTGVGTLNLFTDSGASFPTYLNGRLLRDSNSQVFKILNNTATTLTVEGTPANGVYVILADFPSSDRTQQNFENDIRTTSTSGVISNLVQIISNSAVIVTFSEDELANLIFVDGAGVKYVIKGNDSSNIYLFSTATPTIGVGMHILEAFVNSSPTTYTDNYKTDTEAAIRTGTGLLDNNFYYYTGFSLPIGANVAQAEFGEIDSGISTQTFAISTKNTDFATILYNSWPSVARELDTTEDLQDLMAVFGNFFDELHSYITTYTLQDSDKVLTTALLPLSEQTGLPSIGYSIGADTLRRIARELISCWRLKGSKEGIARFIRVLTTWDITNGTGDFSGAISDYLPNIEALRFFDVSLGVTNTRLTQSSPFIGGGRFVKGLPGIVIPGFFSFREFVISIPNVALFVGKSENFSTGSNTTTLLDSSANFGGTNNLVGNYLLPNQDEINDIYKIISNTTDTITVEGIINNRTSGGTYAVLSPLNSNRFIILNKLLVDYIPFNTKPGFNFI